MVRAVGIEPTVSSSPDYHFPTPTQHDTSIRLLAESFTVVRVVVEK